MKLTPAERRCLVFVSTHVGTRRPAFLGGYRFNFDAPELKRSPFRVATLYSCINKGLVTETGPVTLTIAGRRELEATS